MNEHEKTVKAARQVEVMMGFYIHFVVFFVVCAGLSAVNWLATPEVWWAQWPFLGWGAGILLHALCAFGGGANPITQWRLRRIRELTDPTRPVPWEGRAVRTIGLLVLGLLIGCAAGGGYMYTVVQDTDDQVRKLEASRDALDRTATEREAQLKQLSAERSSLEGTVKGTKEQLDQLQTAKEAAEQALKETRDRLLQEQAARAAAERALAEAKKGTPQ